LIELVMTPNPSHEIAEIATIATEKIVR
jgi:hypothetical protein